jgi:hypothetical protein
MSPATRGINKHAKDRQCCRLTAQERLERDRLQAQQATEALEQALQDTEKSAILRRQRGRGVAQVRFSPLRHADAGPRG